MLDKTKKQNRTSDITIVYSVSDFASKGFDGEIARYMRDHANSAIVGSHLGVDRHVILYKSRDAYNRYIQHIEL